MSRELEWDLRSAFGLSHASEPMSLDSELQLLGHSSIKITERHYAPWVKRVGSSSRRRCVESGRISGVWRPWLASSPPAGQTPSWRRPFDAAPQAPRGGTGLAARQLMSVHL